MSLQEAQHVIACEYGLKSWSVLQAVTKPDFDLLAKAEDSAIQVLVRTLFREADGDLIKALVSASSGTGERILSALSDRQRHITESEVTFLGDLPPEETEGAQRRVMQRAAELAIAGELRWPSPAGVESLGHVDPPDAGQGQPPARLQELLNRVKRFD